MNRGILATCYGPAARRRASTAEVLDCLHAAYDDEPFVVVTDGSPSTKATLGANVAHVTARYDARTGTVHGHRRHRQPGARARRARPCSASTCWPACPRPPACPIAGVYP